MGASKGMYGKRKGNWGIGVDVALIAGSWWSGAEWAGWASLNESLEAIIFFWRYWKDDSCLQPRFWMGHLSILAMRIHADHIGVRADPTTRMMSRLM